MVIVGEEGVMVSTGMGSTVMVKLAGDPGQVAAVGVTVIVAVMGEPVEFVAVNVGIFPVPLAARPIAVLEFVHEYVVPATLLVNEPTERDVFAQTSLLVGTTTFGVGLTVIK